MDFGSLFGGIGSFLSGQATAKGYKEQAKYFKEAGRITLLQGKMKDLAIRREIFQTQGSAEAAAGANNLKLSGSVKDIIKQNRQQGFLTKAVTAMNTQLEYKNYMAQAAQAKANAKAASSGGIMGLLGGIFGMFSDDRLKENVEFVGRRGDGLGVYRFNYNGSEKRYEGVMASEVMVLFPEAVGNDNESGYAKVDYASLGIEFKEVA